MVLKENGIMDIFIEVLTFWVLIILTSELWRSFTLCISFILVSPQICVLCFYNEGYLLRFHFNYEYFLLFDLVAG